MSEDYEKYTLTRSKTAWRRRSRAWPRVWSALRMCMRIGRGRFTFRSIAFAGYHQSVTGKRGDVAKDGPV